MVLYQNDGTGRFHDVTNAADLDRRGWGMGVSVADYDNDGDIDVLIVNLNDRPTLLRNDTRTRHHWVTVRLVGDPTADTSPGGTASTRDAIGARVTIEAAGRTHTREVRSGGSYLSHNDMRVHFGLGDTDTLDRFEIRWPSGVVETINDLEVDRFYIAEESQGFRRITDR